MYIHPERLRVSLLGAAVAAALAGCAIVPEATDTPAAPSHARDRPCPPLPALRPGASALERRVHTQTIVKMYVRCAGAAEDAP